MSQVYYNRISLNDPSADSVALATDLDSYKVLLDAQPSPVWQRYYDHCIKEKGLASVFKKDVQTFDQLRAAGRIIGLPNGTPAEQVDSIVLSAPDNPAHGSSVEAVRVRLSDPSHKGLNVWTLPELVQHYIPFP